MPEANCEGERWWARERVVTLFMTPMGRIVSESAVAKHKGSEKYGYAIERRKFPGFGDWRIDESTMMPAERVVLAYQGYDRLPVEKEFSKVTLVPVGNPIMANIEVFNPETWSYEPRVEPNL